MRLPRLDWENRLQTPLHPGFLVDLAQPGGYQLLPGPGFPVHPGWRPLHRPAAAVSPAGFTAAYPASSITLWILPAEQAVDRQVILLPLLRR
jgi:hypothetical protein